MSSCMSCPGEICQVELSFWQGCNNRTRQPSNDLQIVSHNKQVGHVWWWSFTSNCWVFQRTQPSHTRDKKEIFRFIISSEIGHYAFLQLFSVPLFFDCQTDVYQLSCLPTKNFDYANTRKAISHRLIDASLFGWYFLNVGIWNKNEWLNGPLGLVDWVDW